MATMSMMQVINIVNDETLVKVYQGKTLVGKGNWFEDPILDFMDEEKVSADFDEETNICVVRLIRRARETRK